jgi:carbon-monoxide dehydrogenase medium subunit
MALVSYRVRDGLISEARVALGAVEAQPRRIQEAERALVGRPPERAAFAVAADAAAAVIDPLEDFATSAEYRRDLTRTVTRRALEAAAA